MATTLIQVRRGTEAEWSAANPVLAAGEYGYTTDTAKVKIGSGSAQWSALPYVAMDVSSFATQASLDATDATVALKATQASLDATDALVALNATQASLDATDALVASMATQLSLDATDALVALKAPIDDPTFTTGITTPKIEVQSNGTIQGKDVVGNNTLKLRTIGDSDLSIEPAGTGIVQISTDVNLASGKEFKVDGVALATGMPWSEKTSDFTAAAGNGYFVETTTHAVVASHSTSGVNGKYFADGTYGGATKYIHEDDTYCLYKSGTFWTIESGVTPTAGLIESESAEDSQALPWNSTWTGVTVSEGPSDLSIQMPVPASLGDEICFIDHASTWSTNAIEVIWSSGSPANVNFNGVATISTEWGATSTSLGSICFIYSGASIGWVIKSTTLSANHI